jgi:hypothetical protein
LNAQDKAMASKSQIKKAWMILRAANDTLRGYIRSQSDSTLLFAKKRSMLKKMKDHPDVLTISYTDIEEIHFHSKGSFWKSIGMGAAGGTIFGALIGLNLSDLSGESSLSAQATDIAGMAMLGAGVGIIAGTISAVTKKENWHFLSVEINAYFRLCSKKPEFFHNYPDVANYAKRLTRAFIYNKFWRIGCRYPLPEQIIPCQSN